MVKQVQYRRGTEAEHTTFVGADGEITVVSDTHTLRVHDGVTAGGHELAKVSDLVDYIEDSEKGTANGVATLDGSGIVPESQLPNFSSVETTNTAPTSPSIGDMWYNPDTNQLFIYDTEGWVGMVIDGGVY